MACATRLASLASLCLAAALPLPACHHHHGGPPSGPEVVVHERGGPPPHAPAHGYRRKHRDAHAELELVFDSGLGVYVVVGLPGIYFHADHFYRHVDAGWQVSVHHDSGWTLAVQSDVPSGLRGGPPGHAKGKGKKPHPGPAKQSPRK
jgi:hypothetical protein